MRERKQYWIDPLVSNARLVEVLDHKPESSGRKGYFPVTTLASDERVISKEQFRDAWVRASKIGDDGICRETNFGKIYDQLFSEAKDDNN